jgi:hypothetical protein
MLARIAQKEARHLIGIENRENAAEGRRDQARGESARTQFLMHCLNRNLALDSLSPPGVEVLIAR